MQISPCLETENSSENVDTGHIMHLIYSAIQAQNLYVNITSCSLETLQAMILNVANDILLYFCSKTRACTESNMHKVTGQNL